MSAKFIIELASDKDWNWIAEKHAITVWDSLTLCRQADVAQEIVITRVGEQIQKSRKEHGTTNQAFVVRSSQQQLIGFVWIDQICHGFTGKTQAYIRDIFIAEKFRNQGLGQALLVRAEQWAKQQGYDGVGLSVAAHNSPARKLYEKLGYKTETLRMDKSLGEQGA